METMEQLSTPTPYLYIGILRVNEPWIVVQKQSDRAEHVWFMKVAIIPGDYHLNWTPGLPFNNIEARTTGVILEQKFQGRDIAFREDGKIVYHFVSNEHELVMAIDRKSDCPYQFLLDIAVVTIGWNRGIIRVGEQVHEYREGKLEIVEGATI